jgi:hypothetical protein
MAEAYDRVAEDPRLTHEKSPMLRPTLDQAPATPTTSSTALRIGDPTRKRGNLSQYPLINSLAVGHEERREGLATL